jgi:hypothetical protein
MCRNALGFGGTGILAGEATLCIDMAIAPVVLGFADIIHRIGGFVATRIARRPVNKALFRYSL